MGAEQEFGSLIVYADNGVMMKDIEAVVTATIEEILGEAPADKDIPLAQLGLDSIDALDLFYTLEDKFGIRDLIKSDERHDSNLTQRMLEQRIRKMLNVNPVS